MYGVTRKDKIWNEHIRGTTSVVQASKKITERRLNRYGHVTRRDGEHMYTEESVKSGHIGPTRENEKWMTENKMERCNPTRLGKVGLLDCERARRWTGRHGEGRSSLIPATQ